MPNPTATQPHRLPRLPLILILIVASLFTTACGLFGAKSKVQVPQLLAPLTEANTAQLITEANRLSTVRSTHGKIDIIFEDTSFAEVGIAEKYKQADGQITLPLPGTMNFFFYLT